MKILFLLNFEYMTEKKKKKINYRNVSQFLSFFYHWNFKSILIQLQMNTRAVMYGFLKKYLKREICVLFIILLYFTSYYEKNVYVWRWHKPCWIINYWKWHLKYYRIRTCAIYALYCITQYSFLISYTYNSILKTNF